MARVGRILAGLGLGESPATGRQGLRLLTPIDRRLCGPDKYRLLDLKRRRAQIRARRELGLAD
jgi:hypothetical protein